MISRMILIPSVTLIEDFRRFLQIFTNFDVFAHGSDGYQEANCYQMRSFSWILMDSSNFLVKIHKVSAIGVKCYLNVTRSVAGVKIT